MRGGLHCRKDTTTAMPRKQQPRKPARKRLCFNIVEFDETTGRPLWRSKKSKVDNDFTPTMTDPNFLALMEKVRYETEMSNNSRQSSPFCCVWRNRNTKKALNNKIRRTGMENNQLFASRHESQENTREHWVNFQPFSPLSPQESSQVEHGPASLEMGFQTKDFFPAVIANGFEDGPESPSYTNQYVKDVKRDGGNLQGYQPNDEWARNTVKLHHLDYDNQDGLPMNCFKLDTSTSLNTQHVALTIC